MSNRLRLDSWKEIAKYLGRDVRTLIRWEQQRGLPVYRVPGGKLPRVFAYPDELDRWLSGGGAETNGESGAPQDGGSNGNHEVPPAELPGAGRSPRWRMTAATALVLVAAGGWLVWRQVQAPPTRLTIVGNELLALDNAGRTRWTHRPESQEIGPPEMRWSAVVDLDDDGRIDPLASLEVRAASATQHTGHLMAFSEDGALRWSVTPEDRYVFRGGEYGPPWPAKDLAVYRTAAGARIAWSVHHFTWWPSLLITLDPAGTRVGTFVNSGWIRSAVPSVDERRLFVTGTNNGRQASFLAILDALAPSGRSPEPAGSTMECVRCPEGDPLEYYVLPRTDVSQHQPFPTDGPTVMTFDDGAVQVHGLESGGPNVATVIYELRQAPGAAGEYSIRGARFADSFWEWHRRLEQEGRIAHREADCPHREGFEVHRWTSASGWQTRTVPAR